ncbi:MAG: 16S rRNA (cytosine(1402)-N(4))-methyltransferase RsmH [Ignavibacteriales bacterium]|nr:16S rRNA (cytosine(1402)-N(4))-methyltransferase RsmH [Ignavibacteriales bacterium]MBI3788000.1 16S rRNA (cytosine(1402)-N(4))-methyltransferase RsmH [Ignavibacteriales bacterium]
MQYHTPVLLDEVLSLLITKRGGAYVDATLGGAGHAEAVLKRLTRSGILIGIDADDDAIQFASKRLSAFEQQVTFISSNFKNLKSTLRSLGREHITGILFDLGVSSYQLDEPSKGFSYRSDSRLDMRMNRTGALDAYEVVNRYPEDKLFEVFWNYSEERLSKRLARVIVRQRASGPIETTGDLAAIVEGAVGKKFLTQALSRIFQAIRIEVNDELENLKIALTDAIDLLEKGGRVVVISYHSLEDRIVKQALKEASASSIASGHKLVPDTIIKPKLKILTKKPVEATEREVRENPRARSAKLRAAERL